MPRRRRARSFAPLVIAVTLAACTQPSPTVPSAPALVGTPVSGITISGLPSSVSVGQSFQLTASVVLPDGTQKQTLDATWQSSDITIATISTTGMLKIVGSGPTDITATAYGQSTAAHVRVPFRISGVVHESAPTADMPVGGARVEVQGGSNAGKSTTTDSAGGFVLDVDLGGFGLTVTKDGYDSASATISALPRDQHPDIAITPAAGVVSFSISGSNAIHDLPPFCIPTGSSCTEALITSFPVYHSGQLVVYEHVNPMWNVPALVVWKYSPAGLFLGEAGYLPEWQTLPWRTDLEGGYRYTVAFDGEFPVSDPYKVVLTRPR